jgi:hypothetical protein
MTFAATSQRPNSQPLAQLTGSQAQPGVEKMQPLGAEAGHDLTPAQREAAIEICELREVFYEQEGQHLLADFMRQCQEDLKAGRSTGGNK